MPLNIISYKKAIWKGIEGHLKGIVQKLEDSPITIHILNRLDMKIHQVLSKIYHTY